MEKEFNIFEEFESVEDKFNKSLEDNTVDDDPEDEDAKLEKELEEQKKKAKQKSDIDEDDEEDDTKEDEPEESEEDDNKDSEDEDEDAEDSPKDGYSFKALANYLANEGSIDYEDDENEDDSPEVISKAVLNTAKNMLQEYKDSLPEEGKNYLSYLENGGDPKKYIERNETDSILELDVKNEDNQKKIITEYLKKSDYSEEEIKDILEEYESGLILESQAERALKRLEKISEKEKQKLLSEQVKKTEAQQEAYKKQIQDLENTIESSDKIAGLAISKAERKLLKSYLLDTDKEGVTQWTKDLKEGGVKSQLALAYLQMKKFDFSKLTKLASTEAAQKFKDIFDGKSTTVRGRSSKVTKKSNGDLDAFNKLLS